MKTCLTTPLLVAIGGLSIFLYSYSSSRATVNSDLIYQRAVAQAKSHQYLDAIGNLLQVLRDDPNNDGAKQYLWAIATKMSDARKSPPSLRDRQRWVEDAQQRLGQRRLKQDQVLADLRQAYDAASKNKNPSALLAASEEVQGIFEADPELLEIKESKAREEFQAILAALDAASGQKGFSQHDQNLAKMFLAYFNGDWQTASESLPSLKQESTNDQRLSKVLDRIEIDIEGKKRREELNRLLEQADAYSRSGLLDDAVNTWRDAQKLDPSNPDLEKRIGEAIKRKLDKERELRVQHSIAAGIAHFKKNMLVDAAQSFIDALAIDPNNQEAASWLRLAGHRMKMAKRDTISRTPVGAPPLTRPAGEDLPRIKELYKQGLILYSEGDIEHARETFQAILKQYPNHEQSIKALERINGEPALP